MVANAFVGKLVKPTESQLAATLGATKKLWDTLIHDVSEQLGLDGQEWNSYSPKAGWSLRLKRGKRNILYMSPLRCSFQVALILGDKAIKAARQSDPPKRALKLIAEAPRYPEGTGLRLQVAKKEDLPIIKSLAAIKVQN